MSKLFRSSTEEQVGAIDIADNKFSGDSGKDDLCGDETHDWKLYKVILYFHIYPLERIHDVSKM